MKYFKNFILFAIIFSLFASNAFAEMKYDKNTRIAIIGAGASGLTAAFHLKKKGYENITVYEKRDRVGGKVYSYKHNDYMFELGAFWAADGYKTTMEIADAYGVEYVRENAEMIIKQVNGENYSFKDHLLKNYSTLEIFWAFLNFEWTRTKFRNDVYKIGMDNIHPDLYMPFDQFVKKYKIAPFAHAYRPFWIGCGYGYYDETPAIYVLKLMMSTIEDAFKMGLKSLLSFGGADIMPTLNRFTNGYMSVYEAVAKDIGDVRINTEVTEINRIVNEDGSTSIFITANGETEKFDKVIVSADLRAALKFMDVDEEEKYLFSQVKNYNFHVYLVEASNVDYPLGSLVFLDENGTSDTIGHLAAILNRDKFPNVWTTGTLIPDDASMDDVANWLADDIKYIGGNMTDIIKPQVWNYFPHVKQGVLENGFYERMEALQGIDGTYYIGGIMNFETVEHTSKYSKALIEKFF